MNYQKEMDKIIAQNQKDGLIPHILLHSCCAPCSTHVITTLSPYFDITIFYYNPNIEPEAEYEKRKQEEIRLLKNILRKIN